jgi:hypothetical protein
MDNILILHSRAEFREWLSLHAKKERECWVNAVRTRPDGVTFTYLDAVEEAICFGWIDSVFKLVDGQALQRFSPRKKNSPWTELNKARAKRLARLGLMTPMGKKTLPKGRYKEDESVVKALKKARVYSKFKSFPPLYQRIRMYNVAFFKRRDKAAYDASLAHLIEKTKKGEMYGEWNDYGRLLED